jgi:hypothetical protein
LLHLLSFDMSYFHFPWFVNTVLHEMTLPTCPPERTMYNSPRDLKVLEYCKIQQGKLLKNLNSKWQALESIILFTNNRKYNSIFFLKKKGNLLTHAMSQ